MTSFAPWRRDYFRGAALLVAAATLAASAGAWLAWWLRQSAWDRPSGWHGPPATAALAWLAVAAGSAWLAAAGVRRLRRGAVRRRGKRIERDAIGALGALPWGWKASPNQRLPGGGDVDLLLASFWGRRYAVEIKSKGAVSVERRLFGLRRHLRDAQGQPLARDPVGQALRNARALDARAVLWLPQGSGPAERLTGGVLLVRGDSAHLRRALGIGRWRPWPVALTLALASVALAAALSLLLAPAAHAQAFRPHAQFRITAQQWQQYLDQVRARPGVAVQPLADQHLTVYEDRAEHVLWAFTEPGHPAHPAWIAKRVLRVGNAVGIEQVGYFAGDEVAFGRLFRSYDRAPAQ